MRQYILPLSLIFCFNVFSACGSMTKKDGKGETGVISEATEAPQPDVPLPANLSEAVESKFRSAKNRERDPYRHPLETLKFFDVRPEYTVLEIAPGSGWYTEILAPYLAARGKYIAAIPPHGGREYLMKREYELRAWLRRFPQAGDAASMVNLDLQSEAAELVPPGSVNVVLTFRNVHNWAAAGTAEIAFQTFFRALRPGGTLGVVEHRAAKNAAYDPKAKSGYMRERDVIALARKAGFRLAASAEINANPKDTKDYSEGVWTLPPTFRLGEKDRERYAAIGESDRMTLRFIKPRR